MFTCVAVDRGVVLTVAACERPGTFPLVQAGLRVHTHASVLEQQKENPVLVLGPGATHTTSYELTRNTSEALVLLSKPRVSPGPGPEQASVMVV